jgi:hypothetical protein
MTGRNARVVRTVLLVVAVAGLAVEAVLHLDLAGNYAAVRTGTVSQAGLFRAEGVVALLAAVLLLVRPRRYSAAIAAVVAGTALAALLAYRYWDVGRLGPIPSMYEPIWYGRKTVTAVAEAAALLAALLLVAVLSGPSAPARSAGARRARWSRRPEPSAPATAPRVPRPGP